MDPPRLGPPVKSFLETVKKIRENKEHLVPRPFTLNNNDRKIRMVSVTSTLFGERIGRLVKGSGRLEIMVLESLHGVVGRVF